jgi:aspartate racemase
MKTIMKKIGIIGGLGPVSTMDYYWGIIHGVRAKTGDDNNPQIVINSVNMTELLSFLNNKNWNALVSVLVRAIQNLEHAGADFAAIASNTPHIVFDEVQKQSALPLISIVEATCEYARSKACKKVIFTGTRYTMSNGFYHKAFEKHGITAVVPSENEQSIIHDIIFPKLEEGIVVPEDKVKMLEIVNGLIVKEQADALVLGCTELPLMIKDGDVDALILNTTQIHIEAIINSVLMKCTRTGKNIAEK